MGERRVFLFSLAPWRRRRTVTPPALFHWVDFLGGVVVCWVNRLPATSGVGSRDESTTGPRDGDFTTNKKCESEICFILSRLMEKDLDQSICRTFNQVLDGT